MHSFRPKPLGDGFFAFLSPNVPLVPEIPDDVQDAGRNAGTDAHLFPSDEELTQRLLFIALLICMGWSILALGGALPLYLINVPCLARSAAQNYTYGGYSAIYDLSLLRLLQLLDDRKITTTTDVRLTNSAQLATRAVVDGKDLTDNTRIRIIILTALLIALGVIPALWKILHEFNTVANFRKRWVAVKCANNEMGWLSASKAPGFVGWGEKKLKSYLLKEGLSSKLESTGESRREKRERERRLVERNNSGEGPEIDIESLFSIGFVSTCRQTFRGHLPIVIGTPSIWPSSSTSGTIFWTTWRWQRPGTSPPSGCPPPSRRWRISRSSLSERRLGSLLVPRSVDRCLWPTHTGYGNHHSLVTSPLTPSLGCSPAPAPQQAETTKP